MIGLKAKSLPSAYTNKLLTNRLKKNKEALSCFRPSSENNDINNQIFFLYLNLCISFFETLQSGASTNAACSDSSSLIFCIFEQYHDSLFSVIFNNSIVLGIKNKTHKF
ncbi:hypothetical protein BpHYR1_004115 [Brachionus plicatilis]|uniref:Uncharacterized protein n=1 Tax=Brachionus plicatilis TaxID=10195 RepID=A0A3M7R1L3_BRAPC|nr:hypothetical protein BpHYR1_004115 [Brachionus plicatilis]